MAKPREQALKEQAATKEEKEETEKVGVTLIGYDLFRFRILCATLNLRPSKLLQELIVERLRHFKLPAGAVYIPPSRRNAKEALPAEGEDGEAG